ncbi:siderophore-interacting protein [Paracoccus sp. p4-l81]|uniref:siderophore-interacting protein n=1 Tax=unclassified Paracoccus (in: a-proteobacteria) TaxID=2688777 RepID=UPI0035B8DC70
MPDTATLLESRLRLPADLVPTLTARLRDEAEEHDIDLTEGANGVLSLAFGTGHFSLNPGSGGAAELTAKAETEAWLFVMQEAVSDHLLAGLLSRDDRWSRTPRPGDLAPNVTLVTVESLHPVSADFRRLVLVGAMDRFTDPRNMHLRLLLPPMGRAPVWPRVNARGRSDWPKGEDKLHDVVYTLRGWQQDGDRVRAEIDMLVHPGGHALDWLDCAGPGVQIGLAGPGGGGHLPQRPAVMAGDATAFPVIARLIEDGHAAPRILLIGDEDYPFPPTDATVTRLADADDAVAALTDFIARPGDNGGLWAAGERGMIDRLRQMSKAAGWPRGAMTLAAYWQIGRHYGVDDH